MHDRHMSEPDRSAPNSPDGFSAESLIEPSIEPMRVARGEEKNTSLLFADPSPVASLRQDRKGGLSKLHHGALDEAPNAGSSLPPLRSLRLCVPKSRSPATADQVFNPMRYWSAGRTDSA